MSFALPVAAATDRTNASSRPETKAWTAYDTIAAIVWFVIAPLLRSPILAKIEGLLDHDQAVVGLMALDISKGERLPIFFDGQRYMGALEAYTAAIFVKFLGHSPWTVALAPTFYFALFVAAQYALWRLFRDRTTGHVAALVATVGSPMLAVWSVASRGGYTVILAWGTLVLIAYRAVVLPRERPLPPARRFGWGALLGVGYYLNPIALIVYVTLAIDWTFRRHGKELGTIRRRSLAWTSGPFAPIGWVALAAASIAILSFCCHVEQDRVGHTIQYVFFNNIIKSSLAKPLAAAGIALVVGAGAWFTGFGARAYRSIVQDSVFCLGLIVGFAPIAIDSARVALGYARLERSVPIWIRSPSDLSVTIHDGLRATGGLIGADAARGIYSLVGYENEFEAKMGTSNLWVLNFISPIVVIASLVLIALAAVRDRSEIRSLIRLTGDETETPTALALVGAAVAILMFLFQAVSANGTSMRYLIPIWIFFPGLIARGVRSAPGRVGPVYLAVIVGAWGFAQLAIARGVDRESPLRTLIAELDRMGVRGIVASHHVALLTPDLTSGRIGGYEYHPGWPRLRDRYRARFVSDRPVYCVIDHAHAWYPGDGFEAHLRRLQTEHPDRVRSVRKIGALELWEVDRPFETVVAVDKTE
jgi:hypothetical protein